MFTVIFLNERSSQVIKDYYFLFKPFLDDKSIAFCDWKEDGTDVGSAVPDLYKIIRGKTLWRAIILNLDSMFDYQSSFRPSNQNPFDFSSIDSDPVPHVSGIPMIRLSHIIGGYSNSIKKEFEKGYSYYDHEKEETIRVRESELTKEEIDTLADKYENVASIYFEKKIPEDILRKQREIIHKYSFNDIRPTELYLVSTRKTYEDNVERKIQEAWQTHLEMNSSDFWEKNHYPNNSRFIAYDMTNSENSMYKRELLEFWLSLLTLSTNDISASTLQAYRLYHMNLDLDEEVFTEVLNNHLNRVTSVYSFVKEQMSRTPEYSFDEDEEIVTEQPVPVSLASQSGANLDIKCNKIGLSRNCPEEELIVWEDCLRDSKKNLDKFLKSPRRAIEKSANYMKKKSLSFYGTKYRLDDFQKDDLIESMNDLETEIIKNEVHRAVTYHQLEHEIDEIDRNVRKGIGQRMTRNETTLCGIIVLFLIFIFYIPNMVASALSYDSNIGYSLVVPILAMLVVSIGLIICLVLQRQELVEKMNQYNLLMRKAVTQVNGYAKTFEIYFTRICTYMRAQSILDGIDIKNAGDYSQNGILQVHRNALKMAEERDKEWILLYDLRRKMEVIPHVMSFFNVNDMPIYNHIYYFDTNEEEDNIPINDTGDMLTSPYNFVKKFWIVREEIYTDEEDEA